MNSFYKSYKEYVQKKDVLIKAILSLKIPAGEATARAPLGPTLGQYGIMIADFCNRFNEMTQNYEPGILLKTKVILFADMNYEIFIERVEFIFYLKKILQISKLTPFGKKVFVGKNHIKKFITTVALYELVEFHYNHFSKSHFSFYNYYKMILNQVRNVGIILIPKNLVPRLSF